LKKAIFLFLSRMDFGGQERFVSRLSEMLCEEYDVYVVLLDASVINYPVFGTILDINQTDFSVTSLFNRIKKTAIRCYRLRKFLKQYNPVACMSFGMGPNLINLICKQRGTRALPSIRGYATAERIVNKQLARLLYRRADQVVCVSQGIKNKLEQELPAIADKLVVLYNGYDCYNILQKAQEAATFATSPTNGPRLITVGTLRPEKGYWHLIKAVFLLKKKYPDIHLSIVGEDYQQNGVNLSRLVKDLNLEEQVTFEGYHKNPYSFVRESDVYILSSVREGFPNALVEAMACEKPVVAADCLTGPREILSEKPYETLALEIEKAEYGILVPRLTREEDYSLTILSEEELLAQAIDLLLENPELREAYGKRAAERAAEFSYQACSERVIRILEGEDA